MSQRFVLLLREHRKLGFVFVPVIVQNQKNKEYYIIIETVTSGMLRREPDFFTETQKKITKITEEYSDEQIVKTFSKKKVTVKDYFDLLTDETAKQTIRSYVEKRITKCIDLLIDSNIEIFHKVDKTNHLYIEDRITVSSKEAETVFNFIKNENESRYFLSVRHNGKNMKLTHTSGFVLTNEPCSLVLGNYLYIFQDIDGKKLMPFFSKEFVTIPKSAEKKYFETFVLSSIEKYHVNAVGFDIVTTNPARKAIINIHTDLKNDYVLIPEFHYNKESFLLNNPTTNFVSFEDRKGKFIFHKLSRDYNWEKDLIDALFVLDLKKANETSFKIRTESVDIMQQFETINWLNVHKELLVSAGFEVNQSVSDKKFFTDQIRIDVKVEKRVDWFEVYGTVHFGEYEIPFMKLRHHILKRIREFILPNGDIAVIPEEWLATYQGIFLHARLKNDKLQVSTMHFSLFNEATLAIDQSEINLLNKAFSKLEHAEIEIPANINATLRSYQSEGVAWLDTLQHHNFGGCLADDMGLGKTLQTITLLTKANNEKKNVIEVDAIEDTKRESQLSLFSAPALKKVQKQVASLIVMPTSLIHNWFNELKKFAPHLKVYRHVGSERTETYSHFGNFDVVLTSYGTLRNDINLLKKYLFYYIILDESQYIKNPDSKIYGSVLDLISKHKLVLTGTPIENSLSDLWSQMNFVNEGLLGSLDFFKEEFLIPIEKANDEPKQRLLKKLISPFILRRTKEEVAKDLPPLTEQIVYCDMTDNQQKFYETEKAKIRNHIFDTLDKLGISKSSILIVQALMKLRQIANHPVMVDKSYESDSGKFEEVILHIENLIAERHKILIFSSFVKHLNLFSDYFIKQNIKYSQLTGASTDRQTIIDGFQNDPENFVFLISIKAGGVGLNLTSADYILILDPWWNPAVEAQAISRSHRIGQKKNVVVYRFISANTIEEKILQFQERKSQLAEIFVNTNNPIKALSREDIMGLLE